MIAKKAGLLVSKTPKQIGIGVGLNLKGEFDPEQIEIWLDENLALHGYTYLIPFSKHEASLVSTSIGNTINQETYFKRINELLQLRK